MAFIRVEIGDIEATEMKMFNVRPPLCGLYLLCLLNVLILHNITQILTLISWLCYNKIANKRTYMIQL